MATSTIGHIGPYIESEEDFSSYAERMSLYFKVNKVSEDLEVATFLTLIGGQTYGLLKSLMSPALPQNSSLNDLIGLLSKHFKAKPSEIAERYKFCKCVQGDETVTDYLTKLKKLSTHCNFGTNLNERLLLLLLLFTGSLFSNADLQ